MDVTRLRWRLRGAWQWPAFVAATVAEGVLLNSLPVWGTGAGGLVPGLLLAMAFNLIAVAAFAPLAALLVRRRRPDVPRAIAKDYCGAAFVGVLLVALLAGGIAHRSTVREDTRARAATARALSVYVHNQERTYLARLDQMTVLKIDTAFYRGCVPGRDPGRALCLFVNTDQSPAGVKRDPEQIPNYLYGR
ncbi:MAG: hypothetical protein QOF76_4483 [Solirubrobacteraceae bacterium]|nr:hypothetical protein [Solirubrobacteraceae bacterium]